MINKKAEEGTKLFIKNMVCLRCLKTVMRLVEEVGGEIKHIALGEVELSQSLTLPQTEQLTGLLIEEGFELLDSKASRLVSEIKNLIIREIHMKEGKKPHSSNYSAYVSSQLNYDYSYLSKLFSAVTGITVEKYIIAQKVERIKELLTYGELTVSEIAWELDYSSPQHMAKQFKQVTGLSPGDFRRDHSHERNQLDRI